MSGDAFGPRFRASRRATACLALSASIAIAGCVDAPEDSELSFLYQGYEVWLVTDLRTHCEYLYSRRGGFINRADPHGRVTPNCPEIGGKYGTKLPGDLEAAQ